MEVKYVSSCIIKLFVTELIELIFIQRCKPLILKTDYLLCLQYLMSLYDKSVLKINRYCVV